MGLKNTPFAGLHFDSRFVGELPADPNLENLTRAVLGSAFSWVEPTKVKSPKLLACNSSLAYELGFSPADLESDAFLQAFAGNVLLPGMRGYAACYGGHQFGHWAGQLGDGRAIGLGELIGADGRRHELQLKGAGPTPYSRRADGRAVLRSSLREFVCSEAMHALGVPTTRALTLIDSGETVVRDMFYSGDPKAEPGAIVCRVAPSFLRFGNFELPASRGDFKLLSALVDFTLRRDFRDIGGFGDDRLINWLTEIAERTADLMVHWLRVGFVHGVMNTDNLSILGLTIDYGPYGWLDNYDPEWTPNTTDAEGRRYAFARQAQVAHWNLTKLVGAIAPLSADQSRLSQPLAAYVARFNQRYPRMLAHKLGIENVREEDFALSHELQSLLAQGEVDFTLFYRGLSRVDPQQPTLAALAPAFYDQAKLARLESDFTGWLGRWARRVQAADEATNTRSARMNSVNPWLVPRNYLAQQAIDAAEQGDLSELKRLQEALAQPYIEAPQHARFAARRPDWARQRAGCSMLSCSS